MLGVRPVVGKVVLRVLAHGDEAVGDAARRGIELVHQAVVDGGVSAIPRVANVRLQAIGRVPQGQYLAGRKLSRSGRVRARIRAEVVFEAAILLDDEHDVLDLVDGPVGIDAWHPVGQWAAGQRRQADGQRRNT